MCVCMCMYVHVFYIYFLLFQLISSVDPKFLKLTKSDDMIYTKFREDFPDLDIKILDLELLKSPEVKEVCLHFFFFFFIFFFFNVLHLCQ